MAFQQKFTEALHDTYPLLVSDIPVSCFGMTNIVVQQLESGQNFCLAAGLNRALSHAAENNYDWVMLLDADSVLVSRPNDFPATGYAPTEVWKLRSDETPERIRDARWERSGPLLLGRNVFESYRYCEDYKGYGYEDADFHENVLGAVGIGQSFTDARVMHLWHPPRPTRRSVSSYELFQKRKRKAITLIAYNRPDYLKEVISALSQVKGIEDYRLFCGIDPGCPKVVEMCRNIDFVESEIVVNPARFGVNYNNRRIIQHAFSKGSGFVVAVEDDIVLSRDALSLCNWFHDWENRDAFLLMNLFAGDSSNETPLRVESRRHFCPWGWCVTKQKYEEWIQPAWMRDTRGWDFSINQLIEREPSLKVLTPTLSRTRNIGRTGVHETPVHHDSVFSNAISSNGSTSESFEFISEVPSTYDEVHERVDRIKGWLVPEHARWLFDTARSLPDNSSILEIGAFQGRSSAVFGFGCLGSRKRICSVDTWNGNDTDFLERDYFHVWKRNMAANCLLSNLTPLVGHSGDVLKHLAQSNERFNMVFIDGCHDYDIVLNDFEWAYDLTVPGGWIAMHDVHFTWPGPERVWHKHASEKLSDCGYIDGLAFGRKPL